ncbi:EndoU domain-containing protein [Sneathiella chinensis]|uniref:Bacterial EndoU nuclease domain-containing protein n=1 Tax=Sneathiella chinensis TaxID=349750 RepID=A0ABQ5U6L4_9PROT|nr:EndoU domain-containing protein [Sneathiella chinensis]GLQ07340.1 hypothetical protein GCM10007924_25610 [Sneathiella chinensis]
MAPVRRNSLLRRAASTLLALSLVVAGLFAAGLLPANGPGPAAPDQAAPHWSATEPPLNLKHILDGEISRSGKPTGFHHRAGGRDTDTKRLKQRLSGPNKAGVYTAIVEIYDPDTGHWKQKFSSLFPDRFNRDQLVGAILNAYQQDSLPDRRKWRGPSGHGFQIEGYLLPDGRIITAYPLYRDDP